MMTKTQVSFFSNARFSAKLFAENQNMFCDILTTDSLEKIIDRIIDHSIKNGEDFRQKWNGFPDFALPYTTSNKKYTTSDHLKADMVQHVKTRFYTVSLSKIIEEITCRGMLFGYNQGEKSKAELELIELNDLFVEVKASKDYDKLAKRISEIEDMYIRAMYLRKLFTQMSPPMTETLKNMADEMARSFHTF